jgi:hypothetical protein
MLSSYLPSYEKPLTPSLTAFNAILGPFHPMICSFFSSSSSVAMKNFSSSCCIGLERSWTSLRPSSECERRGTANKRSLRSAFPFAPLFDLQNPDDSAGQQDTRESRRIVDHHDVEGIAVSGSGRWHKAPVMGIGQSGEERFRESEGFELRVVRNFGAAAAGCFDDDMHVAILCEGRKVNEVRHSEFQGGDVRRRPALRPITVSSWMVLYKDCLNMPCGSFPADWAVCVCQKRCLAPKLPEPVRLCSHDVLLSAP